MKRFVVGFVTAFLLMTLGPRARLSAGVVTVVPAGATWEYLDDGSDQGTAWREPEFDDASWSSGPAQLGYGGNGEATVVSFGGDDDLKHVTTYFRHTFEVDAADLADITSYTLRLVRDDGAAVYLNGDEVRRYSLQPDAGYEDFALTTISGAAETTFIEHSFAAESWLHAGTNVVAVEIHQRSRGSSDISMDLALLGNQDIPEFGEIEPDMNLGFEEADVGATSFSRGAGDQELAWTISGSGTAAAVVGRFTDPDDPSNDRQFHINNGSVTISSELIDLRNVGRVQVSADVRTWDTSSGFENEDGIKLSVLASDDGVSFTEYSWLELAGGEATALHNGEHGAFTTFESPIGFIPEDSVSMQVVLNAHNTSNSEHVMFDNVVVLGWPIPLQWNAMGDGNWGDVDGQTGLSHWETAGGDPADHVPGDAHDVLILDDTVTVAQPQSAAKATVDSGTIRIADGQSLLLHKSLHGEAGSMVDLGEGAQLTVGKEVATLGSLTAGDGATIVGDVTVHGVLSTHDASATLNVAGIFELTETGQYVALIDGADQSLLVTEEDTYLDGTLGVEVLGSLPTVGETSRTLIHTLEEASILGRFAEEPEAGEYLGHGVFLRGVAYDWETLNVDLFQAAAGDTDGNGDVNGFDIQAILSSNKFGTPQAADWRDGDFTGDGIVNGFDIQAILSANLFGTGPYAAAQPGLPAGEPAGGVGGRAVPEPGTWVLLAGGLLSGLALRGRKRRTISDPR